MEKKQLVTYFDFAENDYTFFKAAYENGFVANSMAAIAQGICEKYLKYLIELDSDCRKPQYESVMKTHNIRKLLKYIKQEVPGFCCDEGSIKKVDGYYFNTRYPGDESITVDKEDLEECMEAVDACRESVLTYLKVRKPEYVGEEENGQPSEEFVRENRNRKRGR
ncbi:MAG: HEPN domain-containing protein [Roseburia sp.]|nr:HEPN domain-containing protein [Roseburia sp.]